MAGGSSIVAGVAGRYANALFELAREQNLLDEVANDLNGFQALLNESDDLKNLVISPVYSAAAQERAIAALLSKAEFNATTQNFFHVVAKNRRLAAIEGVIKGYKMLLSEHRGEVTAEATSAAPLSNEQQETLKSTLKDIAGRDIELITKVDPSILGGLIVKIGSRQIDDSLRTKLNSMKTRMKEVS
ncbi:MAG: ATP synthase subunit delta [Rhodomicrobium sp.]|nr:MAG: ATP synthase subunit delta [Rhodomicrobium sp.]